MQSWGKAGNVSNIDYCEECRTYGDDYRYDRDGDLVSVCYDCPMNPDSDAWMRRTDDEAF